MAALSLATFVHVGYLAKVVASSVPNRPPRSVTWTIVSWDKERLELFLGDAVRAWGRRWYLVLLCAVLTALGGYQAALVPPRYRAVINLTILAPEAVNLTNPLAALYPSVAVTAAAVAASLHTPAMQQQLRAAGVTGSYELIPRNTGTTQQPRYVYRSIDIINTTDDRRSALRALDILTTAFQRQLKEQQDRWNVAQRLRITTSTFVPPDVVTLPHSGSRALAGSVLLGGLATVVIPLWVDQLVGRRPRSPASILSNK